MKYICNHIIIIATCVIHTFLYAQTDYTKIQNGFSTSDYVKVKVELAKIDTIKLSKYDKATWLFYSANLNSKEDNQDVAYKNILRAKQLFSELKEYDDVVDCNILLLEILSNQNNLELNTDTVLDELEAYIKNEKKTLKHGKIYNQIAFKYFDLQDAKKAIKYFNKAISIYSTDSLIIGQLYVNIGVTHAVILKNKDSALYYYKKSAPMLLQYKDYQTLSVNYNNQGKIYQDKKEYTKAIEYYKKVETIPLKKYAAKTKLVYFGNLASVYQLHADYKNANAYLIKYINLKDSINDLNQNITIIKYKEKFDNEKLRADKLQIEHEKKRTENLLIISSLMLFFGGATSFFVYKNNIKKQKIAKAEMLFEKQRASNILKNEELLTIDAIIAGQEKERQIIASDLHDDLGALIATLQFNFENLYKYRNSEDADKLFTITKNLIKEAHQKIRSIASVKKSGVIAKQGLLKTVTENANKISKLHNIEIEVKAHGLLNRLDNQLELVIFRIIQELITNIIKHAEASKATIHLTNHEKFLNIIVEDNGKGFKTSTVSSSEGMGIQSIKTRVEFIAGTVVIESIINKGTAIIIDIPI